MKINFLILFIFAGLLIIFPLGCGGSGGSDDNAGTSSNGANTDDSIPSIVTTPADNVESSTVLVTSNSSETITLSDGMSLSIPENAVPYDNEGNPGTLVFSVEQKSISPAPVPEDMALEGDVYELGPEGFTMNRPVEVSFPKPEGQNPENLRLMRLNKISNEWEPVGFRYSESGNAVQANLIHFSMYTIMSVVEQTEDTRWIKVNLSNNTADIWISICAVTYSLEYPKIDGSINMENVLALVAPSSSIGFSSDINWWLPQGIYTFQATYDKGSTSGCDDKYCIGWSDISDGAIFTFDDPNTLYELPLDNIVFDNERAPCMGIPTPIVGTGDIQVTLTWQSDVDLDLHVIEPSGDDIYSADITSETGGWLDRDNLCSDEWPVGEPENIYWPAGSAPSGRYTVQVDYYSTCSDSGTVLYTVRVLINGKSNTYTGLISEEDGIISVTTFDIP